MSRRVPLPLVLLFLGLVLTVTGCSKDTRNALEGAAYCVTHSRGCN